MSGHCKHEACFPDTTCALGHLDRGDCEHWEKMTGAVAAPGPALDMSDVPWNGYALGTSDLAILAGRGRPLVVGLVGPAGSGKTTLLAFLYMWLLQHGEVPGWSFAGSWTLGAWETLVHDSRWTGEPPPSFPAHTSSGGRVPGLLHVSLRGSAGRLRDVLLTDGPGEWFTHWAKSPGEGSAAGAQWVVQHSDVLLLLADCEALADKKTLPRSRRATRDLTERVGACADETIPLGFVWTKTDVGLPSPTRDTLERARRQFAPASEVWETTTNNPVTIARLFSLAIDLADRSGVPGALQEPRSVHEPFLAFRGNDVAV